MCIYNTCMEIKTSMGLSKVAYYSVEYLLFVRKSSTVVVVVTIATMSPLINVKSIINSSHASVINEIKNAVN